MQTEKLTSFYGKTKRESDMGNFMVFAADIPAGPASFQKSLFIGTLSLFDWFEIISSKPQNYLFILFNGRCNDNVFSPTINDRNQHAIQ